MRVGRVLRTADGNTVVPVLRLDVELWTDDGKRLGLLTRLRDLLPGRYAIGLTGHAPGGKVLDARRLPAARVRLADRRRPADRAIRAVPDNEVTVVDSRRQRRDRQRRSV